MDFVKYQSLQRFGTSEVSGIEYGTCYVFPKIDGTNASVWFDGHLRAGSRRRELSIEDDNAGFCEWVLRQSNLTNFFREHPELRLYGEWLVPHSLKTYRDDAWRRFYVFDVIDEGGNYMSYNSYKDLLEKSGIDYIAPICKVINGTLETFINQLPKNNFLIKDGLGAGEGVVVKNYDYENKYGRKVWAKIVTSEFKDKHRKEMGGSVIKTPVAVEEKIAKKYVTTALCEKTYAKIENEIGFTSSQIPRLLNTVYYDVVREDCWNFIKENKYPTINFQRLKHFVFTEVKGQLLNVF